MKMELCKNCEYWTSFESEGNEYGKVHYPNHGKCNSENLVRVDMTCEGSKDDTLLYFEYSGYMPFLYPGSRFGCIHFKRRLK